MTGSKSSNSTDLARAAFREVLAPLAAADARARLDFAPRLVADSYFSAAPRPAMTRADMEAMGASGELGALAEIWKREGRDGLLALAPRLRAIADALAAEQAAGAESPDQPSRLIYQMY